MLTNILNQIYNWLLIHGLKILAILIIGLICQKLLRVVIKRIIQTMTKLAPGVRDGRIRERRVMTLSNVFIRTTNIVLWMIIILMVLSEIGLNITPILTGAGILGLAIGFGAKDLVANMINGLFILVEDQYTEGDEVKIAGLEGTVQKISLRTTILKDKEGVEHIIPNGQIKTVSNLSKK
jgi:small conductance mechanosensitive channel